MEDIVISDSFRIGSPLACDLSGSAPMAIFNSVKLCVYVRIQVLKQRRDKVDREMVEQLNCPLEDDRRES